MGKREKGTQVPMVAVVNDGKLLWKSDVPAERPLDVSPSTPPVTLTADRVYALYKYQEFKELPRLTAFDLRTGKRLWDRELDEPTGIHEIRVSSTHVFATSWYQLEAFDPQTGESLYTVGGEPIKSSN
jgi:outer membrane protein assembly factor BamB